MTLQHWVLRICAILAIGGGLLVVIGGLPLQGAAIAIWASVALIYHEAWQKARRESNQLEKVNVGLVQQSLLRRVPFPQHPYFGYYSDWNLPDA